METPFVSIEVFYSCSNSPIDAPLLEQLEHHLSVLRHEGMIATWHKRQIVAGSDWQVELDRHLNTASLILLLISPDFLASEYQYGVELQRAIQRHDENEARVIPILLRPCDWKGTPFEKLQMVPRNGTPLTLWRNRDAGFTEVAKEIRTALQTPLSLPFSTPASKRLLWNVPHHRNPYFTGRDDLFDQLDQHLAPPEHPAAVKTRRVALTQPHAIKGLGGIGKTQVAVEYAYRSRDLGRYTHTFWVNAASEETIIADFVSIAELLPLMAAREGTDQPKLVKAVKRWLEQCQHRWLLIFDNADEVALVRDYLPHQGNGSILLTTRAHAVGSLATSVEVETMGFFEGTQLLLRRAQRFEHAPDEEVNQAGNIVVALDHFPLALDQAGAYLEETQCSLLDYLDLYQTHHQILLAQRGALSTDYPHSVATTWLLSFQKVQQANPAAAELLELCSFLAPDRIPEELLKDGTAYWPALLQKAAADAFAFQQMIADLLKFSLVRRLVEDRNLSIHRLVQTVQKDRMEPQTQHNWAERVVRAICVVFPDDPQDLASWPQCLRYLDQAQACYALIEHYRLSSAEAAGILARTGLYFSDHGFYAIAEPLYQRALEIYEQQLDPDHHYACLENLALLYDLQGRYSEAEPLYVRALSISEQHKIVHPDRASSSYNFSLLYWTQKKYEQHFGANHPNTVPNLYNLAELYQSQGRDEAAEPLYQRAFEICKQHFGASHPDTALSLNNLGTFYLAQGKYEAAEPLCQRALEIYEQHFGANHPSTAISVSNLAKLYQNMGRYEEAEPLYQRALAIYEQHFGANHPDTAISLNDLAKLYQNMGRYEEAEPLLKRALAIIEQILGSDDPTTRLYRENYAALREAMKGM